MGESHQEGYRAVPHGTNGMCSMTASKISQTHKNSALALRRKFARMTTEALKDAHDASWQVDVSMHWRHELDKRLEPLEPRHWRYVDLTSPILGSRIRHPLLEDRCDPRRATFTNWAISSKEDEVRRLVAENDWYSVMLMHTTTSQLDAFQQYARHMDDKNYWRCLELAWTSQEQVWRKRRVFLELFRSRRPGREHLMSASERCTLLKMPNTFRIYRGFIGRKGAGLSWTVDRSKAEWFARRFSVLAHLGVPWVLEGTVRKKDVLAYFNGRREREVVVDPSLVRVVATHAVAPRKAEDVKNVTFLEWMSRG